MDTLAYNRTLGFRGIRQPFCTYVHMMDRFNRKKLQVSVRLTGELVRDPLNVNPSKAQGLIHDDGPVMVMYMYSKTKLRP